MLAAAIAVAAGIPVVSQTPATREHPPVTFALAGDSIIKRDSAADPAKGTVRGTTKRGTTR